MNRIENLKLFACCSLRIFHSRILEYILEKIKFRIHLGDNLNYYSSKKTSLNCLY